MYIDKNTKNKTFQNMFYELQDKGVNYVGSSEILKTENKSLLDFDYQNMPESDPIFGRSYYDMILSECKKNIWFFFREIVRIPIIGQDSTYDHSMQFPLNKTSLLMIWCYENKIPFFVVGDTKKSEMRIVTLQLLCLYDFLFHYNSTPYMHIITDENDVVNHLSDLQDDFETYSSINSAVIPRLLTMNFYHAITAGNINKSLSCGIDNINFKNDDETKYFGNYFGFSVGKNKHLCKILSTLKKTMPNDTHISFEVNIHDICDSDIGYYILDLMPKITTEYISKEDDGEKFTHHHFIQNHLKNSICVIIDE